jgi:hypothetical protein
MKRLLSCFAIVTTLSLCVLAQEKVIDEATYNDAMKKGGEYRLLGKYRTRQTIESCDFESCSLIPRALVVTESESPDRRRAMTTLIERGETEPSTESVFIGNKLYVKRQASDWQTEGRHATAYRSENRSIAINVEYKDLGTEIVGSEEFRVLLKTSHARLRLNGEESDNVQTVRNWIDATGRVMKQELLTTNSKTGSNKLTIVYEPDPTIKIEAPIK